jgi:hypothetical protein
VGVATFTVNNVVIDPEENPEEADCVAVINALPAFKIVTVRPLIDMICAPELSVVNVNIENVLVLVEVGSVKSNGDDPNARGDTAKFDNTGCISVAMYTYS